MQFVKGVMRHEEADFLDSAIPLLPIRSDVWLKDDRGFPDGRCMRRPQEICMDQ